MLRVKGPHYYIDHFNQPRAFIFNTLKFIYMLKRLTVHLENVAPVRVNTGKRLQLKNNKTVEETKLILNNTISVRNLTSQPGIDLALYNIRKDHNIAKCSNNKRSQWKFDQEMWYTSNETL